MEGLIRLEELEEQYSERVGWILREMDALEGWLQGLDEREADVIREYYFRGNTWGVVAERLGLSESWMFKLHKRAIERECDCFIELK